MLKKIKTTKHMRLDELIKYVWENDINNTTYYSMKETSLGIVDGNLAKIRKKIKVYDGRLQTYDYMDADDLFPVEIEKEITEDTEFDCVISVDKDGYTFKTFNTTIEHLNSTYSDLVQILAYINGKFITIWECENQWRSSIK